MTTEECRAKICQLAVERLPEMVLVGPVKSVANEAQHRVVWIDVHVGGFGGPHFETYVDWRDGDEGGVVICSEQKIVALLHKIEAANVLQPA